MRRKLTVEYWRREVEAAETLLTRGTWPTGLPVEHYERRVIAHNLEWARRNLAKATSA